MLIPNSPLDMRGIPLLKWYFLWQFVAMSHCSLAKTHKSSEIYYWINCISSSSSGGNDCHFHQLTSVFERILRLIWNTVRSSTLIDAGSRKTPFLWSCRPFHGPCLLKGRFSFHWNQHLVILNMTYVSHVLIPNPSQKKHYCSFSYPRLPT